MNGAPAARSLTPDASADLSLGFLGHSAAALGAQSVTEIEFE